MKIIVLWMKGDDNQNTLKKGIGILNNNTKMKKKKTSNSSTNKDRPLVGYIYVCE